MYLKLGFFLGLKDLIASSHLPLLPTNCISISAKPQVHSLTNSSGAAALLVGEWGAPLLAVYAASLFPKGTGLVETFPSHSSHLLASVRMCVGNLTSGTTLNKIFL